MERVEVVSSEIAEVGYNASSRTLEVMLRSGAIYLYYFVPQDAYDALVSADSKGTYFRKSIRGVYEHHQIAEPRPASERRTRKRAGRRTGPRG